MQQVASRALMWWRVDLTMHVALINGPSAWSRHARGRPFSIMGPTIRAGKIVEMTSSPTRTGSRIDLAVFD